jgi:hypothetical protein
MARAKGLLGQTCKNERRRDVSVRPPLRAAVFANLALGCNIAFQAVRQMVSELATRPDNRRPGVEVFISAGASV